MPNPILAEALLGKAGPMTQGNSLKESMEPIWGSMVTFLTHPHFPCPYCGLASGLLGISPKTHI